MSELFRTLPLVFFKHLAELLDVRYERKKFRVSEFEPDSNVIVLARLKGGQRKCLHTFVAESKNKR